jgi:hypothetical protein
MLCYGAEMVHVLEADLGFLTPDSKEKRSERGEGRQKTASKVEAGDGQAGQSLGKRRGWER